MNTRSMTSGMLRSCSEKLRITAEAEKLCALLGPGWTTEVWINTGWYYRVRYKNIVYVYPSIDRPGSYFCMLGSSGAMSAQLTPEHIIDRDPRKAVERTLAGYRVKWEKYRAEQEEIMAAGDECVKGWQK